MSDIENLRDTIVPKSDQLNADDLTGITRVIRVTSVKRGTSKDQPVSIEFLRMDGRPYKPCKSMRRVLIEGWGDDGRKWIGRSMRLYNDPEVKYGGVRVGGIRICQLSHMDKDLKILLTSMMGKRYELLIPRLPTYPAESFEKNKNAWIAAIKAGKLDIDTLIDKASQREILTDEQIEYLKKETE